MRQAEEKKEVSGCIQGPGVVGAMGSGLASYMVRGEGACHMARPARLIHRAYRQYGYRLAEIVDHLGVHAATVSRRFKQAKLANV